VSATLIQRTKAANFLPIWSCSVWGLPCPRHYWRGGALLPHLFTLTPALPPRRYVFCGTFRQPGLNPASRTLSGTLLCGVRTFLSLRPKTLRATVRSGCLRNDYIPASGSRLRNAASAFAVSSWVRLVDLIWTGAPALLRSRTPRAGSRPHEHR